MPKFIQSLDNQVYAELEKMAKERGITVQTLIRAVIVPEWSTITRTDTKYEKANLTGDEQLSNNHSSHYTANRANHHSDTPAEQQRNTQQVAQSTIFHLRHFKPSSLFEEAKQEEEKAEKADIVVCGRKRRHH